MSKVFPSVVALSFAFCGLCVDAADRPEIMTPKAIENGFEIVDGWESRSQFLSATQTGYGERIAALQSHERSVWIGTSFGRLLHWNTAGWQTIGTVTDANNNAVQVTGIALGEEGVVWLSTSDGIQRLTPNGHDQYVVDRYATYYQGHPAFVSGAYMPGVDAARKWGYVDDIYIPKSESSYAPFVVSTEHGLFSWTRHGVWHHFLPHYWGANSPWLDTRELVPHRRPTGMVEDVEGHLWIASDGDGLIRMDAAGRKYLNRNADNNEKDGTEFTRFGPDEISTAFDRVASIAKRQSGGVVCSLVSRNGESAVASFNGKDWRVVRLDAKWTPLAVVGRDSDVAWVGIEGRARSGLYRVDFETSEIEAVPGVKQPVRAFGRSPDGKVIVASWWEFLVEGEAE